MHPRWRPSAQVKGRRAVVSGGESQRLPAPRDAGPTRDSTPPAHESPAGTLTAVQINEVESDTGDAKGTTLLPMPTSRRAMAFHTAALAAVLLALLALVNTGQIGFVDEGIYSAQVDNLSRGSWSALNPAGIIDPSGSGLAATGGVIVGDRYIPYARQAVYPLLLLPGFLVGGVAGMLVVSLAGTVVAALAAALLARRIEPSLGIPALWVTGIGSPLLFGAFFIVGHSLAAAFAGLLAVSVCAALDDRRTVWLFAAIPLAAALTMVRSEGVLVVLALGLVVGISALRVRPQLSIEWRTALIGGALGVTGTLAYLVNLRIAAAIIGEESAGPLIADRDANALSSAWISLLRPWDFDARLATPQAALMAVCTVLATITYRLLPRFRLLSLGLLTMAAVSSVLLATGEPKLISGLVPVFPAAILGLGLLERADLGRPVVQRCLATSALVAVGVLATSYGVGGGFEWGGRFYYVLIPLIVAPAMLGLSHATVALPRVQFRVAGIALLVMILALSAMALRINHAIRQRVLALTEQTAAFTREFGGTPTSPVVIGNLRPGTDSRYFWRELGNGQAVMTTGNIRGISTAVEAATAAGLDRIVVVTDTSAPLFNRILGDDLRKLGWSDDHWTQIQGTQYYLALLTPDSDLRS